MNKIVASPGEAVAGIFDGATILVGGVGDAGAPYNLLEALVEQGAKDLVLASCAFSQIEIPVKAGRVKKAITSFPIATASVAELPALHQRLLAGEIEHELVPLGTLAERVRAGGAGIPAFYTPVGVGTLIEEKKEKRVFDGSEYILERALTADFALVKAYKSDRMGNLVYRKANRNLNTAMATAARVTIAEVDEIVEVGELDPEIIVTPGIFVDRVVKVEKRSLWLWKFKQLH